MISAESQVRKEWYELGCEHGEGECEGLRAENDRLRKAVIAGSLIRFHAIQVDFLKDRLVVSPHGGQIIQETFDAWLMAQRVVVEGAGFEWTPKGVEAWIEAWSK